MTFGLAFALGFCACLVCVAVGFVVAFLRQLERSDAILKGLHQSTCATLGEVEHGRPKDQ